jgi:hypothetical protein
VYILEVVYLAFSVKMGCDGGTIPTRDELVRTKKKPEQVSVSQKWQNKFL